MEKFLRIIDRASDLTGKWASLLAMLLTISISYDILMRYIFSKPSFWAYDMTIMIFGAYTMLGAAYCHYKNGHVRMDLLYGRLSPRKKAIVDSICYLILFFPLMIILFYTSAENALWAVIHEERASASSWRPWLGPFKIVITFGFLLFLLQGLADFLRGLVRALKGGDKHES